jgi:tRNA A-37 threonylcarbamoyl transferase component Bud32
MSLQSAADALARGETPPGADLLKDRRVRGVAVVDGVLLKVYRSKPSQARREARALRLARERDVPVPELVDCGPNWVAMRFLAGREARRDDLEAILPEVARMHARGMLHGDLHLGNIWLHQGRPVFIDLHGARFAPFIPGVLRRRELGFLAYSLGEPLPEALESCRFWRDLRAQRHWRSRTRRCLVESTGFTAFERGFRRRTSDPDELREALEQAPRAENIKRDARTRLVRVGQWILKEHARVREARAAWVGGYGLEMRGIRTGRALAWSGRWLVMEDAGSTLHDWIERHFADARDTEASELADTLGELLAALHRRGIYHADLKANNLCWSPGREPRLVDYGRVRFGRRVSTRRRIKNLAQLNAAILDSVPASLRERTLAVYAASSALRPDPASFRTAVIRESLARNHHWTGCKS